jgi:hypothetical protein
MRYPNEIQAKDITHTPKPKYIIGLVYADWCGHCNALKLKWDNSIVPKLLKHPEFNGHIYEKENSKNGSLFDRSEDKGRYIFNPDKIHKGIEVNYFPTIFKVENERLEYFQGERTEENLYNWAMTRKQQGGGNNKYRKRKSKQRRTKSRKQTRKNKRRV